MISSAIFRLVAGMTLIRLAFAATTGLGVDESYMVTAGRILCLGYFDHPPASWWLSWGAAQFFGTEAPWAVRLPFILLFALSQVLMWRITCLIADRRAAYWAVVALNVSPVFGVTTGSWVLPDGPLDAALLGAALCLLHALSVHPKSVHPKSGQAHSGHAGGAKDGRALAWWAGGGLCAGLAMLSKYSAVLTIAGALLFLLSDRSFRWWLSRPQPYFAAVLALAVFSPVLIWNATHGWASFAFQGDRAAGLRFRAWMPLQTLGGEALFVLPWVWVPMMILFVTGFRRDVIWSRRLLVWLAAPPIVAFALISVWSSQRVLYHWAAPGYLMLFPLLGEAMAHRLDRLWVRGLIAGSASLVLLSAAAVAAQIRFDWLGGTLAVVFRVDPTAEGLDWTSIGDDLRARGLLPPGALAAALNWRDAGKIGRALGPDVQMLCLNTDCRQFDFARRPGDYDGKDVLVLSLGPADQAAAWFLALEALPGTSVRLDGRVLRPVAVVRGEGLMAR